MRINSTNLKQFEGGAVVKQGDSASAFGYWLLDEQMNPINDLNGKNATIRIFNQNGKATFEGTVENSKVTFKINKVLPVGSYLVEAECDGYIFPSDRSARLEITQSAEKFTSESELELVKNNVRDEVAKYINDHQGAGVVDELPDLTTLYNLAKI